MTINIIFIFSFFILLFKEYLNYIVYPLRTLDEDNKNFESLLSFNSTYTILQMGTPPKDVNFYFNLSHAQINITDEGCSNHNLYNKTNSSSFKVAFELDESDQDDKTKYLVLDTLSFKFDINLARVLKIEEYPFYYSSNISRNDTELCGNIGLSVIPYYYMPDSEQVKYYTDELKKLGAEKYEDFSFFHYNNKDFFINSVFLEIEFPDLFRGVKGVSWEHLIYGGNNSNLNWEISMKEIYYNNIHSKINIIFEFNPLFELIIGTNNFKSNISNDFFNSYINKGICSIKEFNGLNYFECDSEKFTNKDINSFPTIYIANNYINHIFELNYQDLFIKINNKVYFKIVFPVESLDYERWILGKIFMRKYPVRFSPLSRLLGFYIKPNEGEINKEEKENGKMPDQINNDSNNKNGKIYIYVIIIVVALIFTGLGLFLGKKIFYPRKKRANELLDDNYQYESEVNKENNKEKNNEILSKTPIN